MVAGLVANRKVTKPYTHAVIGSLAYTLLSALILFPLISWGNNVALPAEEETGLIILAVSPSFFLSMFGASLGIAIKQPRQHSEVSNTNQAKGRHFLKSYRALSIGIVAAFGLLLIAIIVWVVRIKDPVQCPDAPTVATLNHWPVSYESPAEWCHDYPPVDARIVGDSTEYSKTREQWEYGLTAKAGDEIYVLTFINNGAVASAENIHPGQGIARNVSLTTQISGESSDRHDIRVQFSGTNTNNVSSSFKINTDPNNRLKVVPLSGEIRDFQGAEVLRKDLDVGNNSVLIGDLAPRWDSAVFVRFRLKVY